MRAQKTNPCPACGGSGIDHIRGTDCPFCKGTGIDTSTQGFPVPFHYPFKGTLAATGLPGSVAALPTLPVPGVTAAPVLLVIPLANEADFEWIFTMGQATAAQFVALVLTDLSSNFDFQSAPVAFLDFAGNAQLPLTILEPYRFGRKTQLKLTATFNAQPAQTQAIAIVAAGGSAGPFTGTLQFPILPGSVTVMDVKAGGQSAVDDGNGNLVQTGGTTKVGTVNYATGAITVTFTGNATAADSITVTYMLGVASNVIEVDLFGFQLVGAQGIGQQTPAQVSLATGLTR